MHGERWALGATAEVGERQVNCLGNKWEGEGQADGPACKETQRQG